ncbi:MAG: FAD-dependent oxidoreductase [Propioniciclava sp.]
MYDVIIIGGGPTGASAAMFTARAGLTTLVVDANRGVTKRAMVNNHLGLTAGMAGPDLVAAGRMQAEQAGSTWLPETAANLTDGPGGILMVHTEAGTTVAGRAVILATGFTHALAETAGIELTQATEPRVPQIVAVDAAGHTSRPGVWAAGTIGGTSVHTIITAGDGARVAINLISELRGERHVDHDLLPAPDAQ